jgi:chemotaxis protein methyltransferase CheR
LVDNCRIIAGSAAMSWTQPCYEEIARLLTERTGLTFPPERQDSAEQGIHRAMAVAGVADLGQYRTVLETDGHALDDLIIELTIGETYFFREPAHFEFIGQEVLPDIRKRRGPDHGVRAWSAGCASGEEAYSLAIVLVEEGLAERAYVLATDISRAALAKAKRAVYREWSLRGEWATRASPFLSRQGNLYLVEERLRRAVTFEYLNLAVDVYPSLAGSPWGMDLILCRNVLIYFSRETVGAVARRLYESLAPGGWLLTSSADPPLGGEAALETVATRQGVFYRRPEIRGWGEETVASTPYPVLPTQSPAPSPLEQATAAFARGDYARTVELTQALTADPTACLLYVRALVHIDPAQAERACARATAAQALVPELHLLHAMLLLELGRCEEATEAARRLLYLDRSLAVGHFTLGLILRRCGDAAGAGRAFRNARDLCAARPAEELVPLADGERAGRLAAAAAAQLDLLVGATQPSSR